MKTTILPKSLSALLAARALVFLPPRWLPIRCPLGASLTRWFCRGPDPSVSFSEADRALIPSQYQPSIGWSRALGWHYSLPQRYHRHDGLRLWVIQVYVSAESCDRVVGAQLASPGLCHDN